MDTKDLLELIAGTENAYLYGAGKFTKEVIKYCRGNGIEVKGVIVTDTVGNPQDVLGVRVIGIDDVNSEEISKINLIVSISGNLLGLKNMLAGYEFNSIYYLPGVVYRATRNANAAKEYAEKSSQYYLDENNPFIEIFCTVVCDKESSRRLCRVEWDEICKHQQYFMDKCIFEEFNKEYGKIIYVPHEVMNYNKISDEVRKVNKIEMFSFTSHLDDATTESINEDGFIPLQVGAALTSVRKKCLTDDLGDNISYRNKDYSECTGIYWLWRNRHDCKYIGTNHYRRRLALNDDSMDFIKEKDVDIVASMPHFSYRPLKEYFQRFITEHDWELMKRLIIEYDDAYKNIASIYESSHFFFPCNVALFKREVFEKYCEFAFNITEKIYLYYKKKGWVRNDRYMGYIFECLESQFLMRYKNELSIGCSDVMYKMKSGV